MVRESLQLLALLPVVATYRVTAWLGTAMNRSRSNTSITDHLLYE
jgi:hypothetical protein